MLATQLRRKTRFSTSNKVTMFDLTTKLSVCRRTPECWLFIFMPTNHYSLVKLFLCLSNVRFILFVYTIKNLNKFYISHVYVYQIKYFSNIRILILNVSLQLSQKNGMYWILKCFFQRNKRSNVLGIGSKASISSLWEPLLKICKGCIKSVRA